MPHAGSMSKELRIPERLGRKRYSPQRIFRSGWQADVVIALHQRCRIVAPRSRNAAEFQSGDRPQDLLALRWLMAVSSSATISPSEGLPTIVRIAWPSSNRTSDGIDCTL